MSTRRPSAPSSPHSASSASDLVRLVDGLSSRGNNSPSLRHGRAPARDLAPSADVGSLRMDELLAAELSSSRARNAASQSSDSDSDSDEDSQPLLRSSSFTLGSKSSPVQVVRKLSITSPSQPSRMLANGSSGHSHSIISADRSSTMLSYSPSQPNGAPTPTLMTADFVRPHSSSFSSSSGSSSLFASLPAGLSSVAQLVIGLRHHPLRASLCLVFSILLPLLVLYVTHTGKCDMSANLAPMLRYTAQTFNEHGISYWLDYGTLLGAAREGGIIPHEFDIDMSSAIEECDRILELRSVFEQERGYRMYGRDDWVREKASFVFGYGGYLHKPCVRIYDPATLYYVDIDWHQRLSAAQLPQSPQPATSPSPANLAAPSPYGSVYLPRAYQPRDGDVWCNEEGFNGNDPGGCRRDRALFPLGSVTLYGVEMKVPALVEEVLRDMYGDGWRVPRAKGYKALVCTLLEGAGGGVWRVWAGVVVWEACMLAVLWQLGKVDQKVVAWVRDRYQ